LQELMRKLQSLLDNKVLIPNYWVLFQDDILEAEICIYGTRLLSRNTV